MPALLASVLPCTVSPLLKRAVLKRAVLKRAVLGHPVTLSVLYTTHLLIVITVRPCVVWVPSLGDVSLALGLEQQQILRLDVPVEARDETGK
jgi:hypothetical protein